MREGPEPRRVFLLERLHAVREADELLVRRRAVERRLNLRLPLSVLPEQRARVAVATAMDEVQCEDGEEVPAVGAAVPISAARLAAPLGSRPFCAAAGEERAARASVGVEEEAKGERALAARASPVARGVARAGRGRGVILDADDAGGDPVSRSVTARTPPG